MNLQVLRNLKPGKTWIILGVALTVGVMAALGARAYLANQMAAIQARAHGETVGLIVAKRELRRGEVLSTETVAVRAVPVDFAHSGAVTPNEFERIDGQRIAFNVKPGELILWSMLETKRAPTFSARIAPGRRAITVPVDEINSISGMLEPGDVIDLLVTVDQQGRKTTVPLLRSVQVMATGQRSVDDPKGGERRIFATVTLDTTPEQAENIIIAREAGKITALLRNPADKQPTTSGTDLAKLLGGKTRTAALTARQVPVIYGGQGGQVPAEALKLGQYVQLPQLPSVPNPVALTAAASPQAKAQ